MSSVQQNTMKSLYGLDIWAGFEAGTQSDEIQGWNGNHPSLRRLVNTVTKGGSRIVVDVGVWKGQSTINMAKAMQAAGIDGCIIAVDTFLGSPEHWPPERKLFRRVHSRPDLFETFLSNVANACVQDIVIPFPQTSKAAALILARAGIRASLVHIDAAHEYNEVIQDAEEYWKIVEVGGFMIGDDYHETWPGVVRAAGEFSSRHSCPLQIEPPKWIVQKK